MVVALYGSEKHSKVIEVLQSVKREIEKKSMIKEKEIFQFKEPIIVHYIVEKTAYKNICGLNEFLFDLLDIAENKHSPIYFIPVIKRLAAVETIIIDVLKCLQRVQHENNEYSEATQELYSTIEEEILQCDINSLESEEDLELGM